MDRLSYQDYLKSDHWKEIRRAALEFYGFACCLCGKRDNLNVHHRNYNNLHNENIQLDLIVLCKDCHTCFHGKLPEYPFFSLVEIGGENYEEPEFSYLDRVFMGLTNG